MKIALKPIALSMLLVTGTFAGAAYAVSPATTSDSSLAVNEARAQLKADQAALAAEERQLSQDEAKLRADRAAGRLAATSPDALRVYKDEQAIDAERKVIAADQPGTLQMKADQEALRIEKKLLAEDKAQLRADRLEGRMAAQSEDSERTYRDLQFINGEKKDIADDRAALKAARKG